MKIVVIRHSILNRGGDQIILDYSNYLISHGHKIVFYTQKINTTFLLHPSIEIRTIPIRGKIGTLIFSFLKHFDADVVLVDLAIMAFFTWFRNRRSIIYFAQEWDVNYYKNIFLKFLLSSIYFCILSLMKVHTIAVSGALKEKLILNKSSNVEVVVNGIDIEIFRNNPESSYIKKRSKKNTIALFLRTDYRKGKDIGLKSLEYFCNIHKIDDFEVWFFGENIAPLNLPYTFRSFGFFKTPEELRDFLSAADIYLVPSRSEGFSLLTLQSMACQNAIISTKAVSFIKDGIDGILSPINDHVALAENIEKVLKDEQLCKTLRVNAGLSAQKYDIKNSRSRFEEALLSFNENKRI